MAKACSAGVLACEFWRRLAASSLGGAFPGTGTVPALAAEDEGLNGGFDRFADARNGSGPTGLEGFFVDGFLGLHPRL